ncbi:tetratricopeptide repeat protein [Altericroceibacterium xinjiangense]|uniref:tetratricopeptide repeat protein n=1 Tax=Altericroceibacterium xinjiangense TaxID=762261 RepID=UPI001F49D89D|nr:tetratricopeptide repeat protein [Altericroceibacterium xinjiangense]
MALTPTSSQTRTEKLAQRNAAEQDMLLREVDDAVRQDHYAHAAKRYGIIIIAVVVLALLAFGGWLWWRSHQNAELEASSEQLVLAMDQLQAGNGQAALERLEPVAEDGSPGAQAAATMLRAGVLLGQDNRDEAVQLFESVAADDDAPEAFRNIATIRAVSASYDTLEPEQVIERLKPLATPGNPWFGSAGELVALAYLQQGKEELAGPLLVEIARDDELPQSLRSRTRQLAGVLGYDAVEDVDETLRELRNEDGAAVPGAAAAQ